MSVDSIESLAAIGHPHVHGSRSLLCVFAAHFHPSVAVVTAAGNRCSASSALRVSVEGTRPRIASPDRLLWSVLAKVWSQWRTVLFFVQPRTVTLWQQKRFRDYWRVLSRDGHPGRPKIAPEHPGLIRRMWQANPTWGSPRIVAELHKLGIDVAKSTVEKYKPSGGRSPSATWRTFLDQHLKELVAIDFFIVPTATFKVLFVFLVLAHDRRQIVHFNVTEHPTAQWTAQQIVEAFPCPYGPAVSATRRRWHIW